MGMHHLPTEAFLLFDTRNLLHFNSETAHPLEVNKSTGPGRISVVVLKTSAPELTPVLVRLFKTYYTSGQVTCFWKIFNIHPTTKKGDQTDTVNYIPNNITSFLSKVMEQAIIMQLRRLDTLRNIS